jgi:hypothetical protein
MSVSRVIEAPAIRIGDDEGSEGVISVSLFAGKYADAVGDMAAPCWDPVGARRGVAWNESDNGPIIAELLGVSEQDLRKFQNCRSEL